MGLLDKIKQDAQKSGGSKSKFFYVKDGDKRRVRFLQDMDDGMEVTFHDSFEANINIPCREMFGKSCPYCEEEGLRTRIQYAWSVWDYDSNEVKVFMFPMNNCSPIGNVAAMYETYGTLLDRDFIVQRTGKQQNTSYTVIPMDKNKFRNEKAKPYSKKAFLELLDKAYPDEHANLYEDEPKKMKKKTKVSDEDEEKELPWGENAVEIDYSKMSAKELYQLCEKREIEAEPKNPKDYYIELLEEYDAEQKRSKKSNDDDDDWGDDDDEAENDYSSMSAKELYKLCKERDIEALPKKNEKYYINLLEEDDKAHDEWEDDEEDDEEEDW